MTKEYCVLNFSYTVYDESGDREDVREITKRFSKGNSPTEDEMGNVFSDFSKLIGYDLTFNSPYTFSYSDYYNSITPSEDQLSFNFSYDNMGAFVDVGCDNTITLTSGNSENYSDDVITINMNSVEKGN